MSRLLFLASALSVLAACGPGPQAMPARPPKPEAPAPGPAVFLVTPAAVGPATASTPFDRNAVQRLFRGADVSLEFVTERSAKVPLIVVRGPGDLWIEFRGRRGTLSRATVRGSTVRGPAGEKSGDNSGALGFRAGDCVSDPRTRTTTCLRPDARNLAYVFDNRGIKGDRLIRLQWSATAP